MSEHAMAGMARTTVRPHADAAGRDARFLRRRLLALMAVIVVVSGGAWFGRYWWTVGRFIESTDDAFVGGDITAIAPKVSGYIAALAVTDNQLVHAGDILLRLDDRDYRAALAKAEADVAAQRARLSSNAAARRLQTVMVTQAQAALDATAAQTVFTRFDDERYRSLARDQFASQQRFQLADAESKKAVAADAQARAAVGAAERQVEVIDAARVEIAASLAAALAERETARLNLGYAVLRAPADGAVGNRSAQIGAYVTPGTQLLSLVSAQGLWVDANFKESQLARLKAGMKVTIVADVLPGEVFHGHVASLAPATGAVFSVLPAENATGNFTKIVQRVPVRVTLDGDGSRLGPLRPGLSVTASVDERQDAR